MFELSCFYDVSVGKSTRPMVSHQTLIYRMAESKLLMKETMIWFYAFEAVNKGRVDITAQGFNQSGNQTLNSHFPW